MITDRAIKRKEEDILGRFPFVEKLSKALYDWKEEDSLVISLTGKWGTGKSSIINLVKEYIEKDKSEDKPTVIDFNPWMFSNINNLSSQFFNELSKELNIQNDSEHDKKLAKKISLYSDLLNIFPTTNNILSLSPLLTMILGVLGISISKLIDIFNISETVIQITFYVIGIISLLAGLLKQVSNILIKKADVKIKSISEIKKEISDIMKTRTKKLVIVIDDIDRLTPDEIKEMFKLVRVNADFPKTIYILAFDKEIIERSLETKSIINGKSYIDKIVQVNFDIPRVVNDKIQRLLFQELDNIFLNIPQSSKEYFDQQYWIKIYNSGYKHLFRTLRDVKRYMNSLEFNMSLVFKENSIEINPIDFFAIEAIRVFYPSFFDILKNNKDLFTMTTSDSSLIFLDETKKKESAKQEFQEIIEFLEIKNEDTIVKLICNLFPDLGNAYKCRNLSSDNNYSKKRKDLNVCSPVHFDTYFSLIPGGDEKEVSQFKIDSFIKNCDNCSNLEKSILKFIEDGKLRSFLERFWDYVNDEEKIDSSKIKNIIQAFFNTSDNLGFQDVGFFGSPPSVYMSGIIRDLLHRFEIKERFSILAEVIEKSTSLSLPIAIVSYEVHLSKEKDKNSDFSEEMLTRLKGLCVNRIEACEPEQYLVNLDELPSVLHSWNDWSDGIEFEKFINFVKGDVNKLLDFVDKFFKISTSNIDKRFSVKQNKILSLNQLSDFISPQYIVEKFEVEKQNNSNFYNDNKDLIEKTLDNIKNKNRY